MKLLFDANLAPSLVVKLRDLYPDSSHVQEIGLSASDSEIWEYARTHNYIIVSKDTDFHQRVLVLGPPPKVLWVRLGNCKTALVETLLRQRFTSLQSFHQSAEESLLVLP